MKKKILIKENELEMFVKSILKERSGEQLSLDFTDTDELDSITQMLKDKLQEVKGKVSSILSNGDIDDSSYAELESIHDEIFELWKHLNNYDYNTEVDNSAYQIVEDFNTLEDFLVSYLEIYKEYKSIKEELDSSYKDLTDFLNT